MKNTEFSAARAARRFLFGLIALAGAMGALLLWLAADSEGLWSHVYHFCLLAWNAFGEHLIYLPQILLVLLPYIGIGLMLMEVLSQVWRTRRAVQLLRSSAIPPPARLRHIARRLDIDTHITMGLLDFLDDDELVAVLLHERTHLRARDPLQLLVSRALARGMFFLPIARDLASGHELAQEIAADAEVVQILGGCSTLASALLKLLESPQDRFYATLAVGGFSHVDARIEHLAEADKRIMTSFNYAHLAWSGIVAVLLVASFLSTLSVSPTALSLDPDCIKQLAQLSSLSL